MAKIHDGPTWGLIVFSVAGEVCVLRRLLMNFKVLLSLNIHCFSLTLQLCSVLTSSFWRPADFELLT